MQCSPRHNLGHVMVLKLKKSLYDQVKAPSLWFEKLAKGLQDRGFKPRSACTCMFIPDKVIYLVYVENWLWFSKKRRILMR